MTDELRALATAAQAAPRDADWKALGDLARFARIELASRDLEPWADLLAELLRAGTLDRAGAAWALTLYNTYDDLGSAWSVLRRWPDPWRWAMASDRDDAADYPMTSERRNLRGGRVLRRLASTVAQLDGADLLGWLKAPLRFDDPGRDFDRLVGHLRQVWGVGRQAAFEWAEFCGKVLGWPVDAAHGWLWESEGPRRSLQALYPSPRTDAVWLDACAWHAMRLLDRRGVRVKVVDFETVVCDFHVMRAGRYYPGRHLAALREELHACSHRWPADRAALSAAWYAVVPAPWATITPGIDKRKLAVYRDTGRIITAP